MYVNKGAYQMQNRRRRVFMLISIVVVTFFILLLMATFRTPRPPKTMRDMAQSEFIKYALQQSYLQYNENSTQYRFAIVADLDKASKIDTHEWKSILKTGVLTRDPKGSYSITWEAETELKSQINEAGRSMELSELTYFDNRLLTISDRAGIVYEIEGDKAIPLYILTDGNGRTTKGFKAEWATVKDELLYIGSTGKEWTNDKGELVNNNPMWVKTIDKDGRITHIDWSDRYQLLRKHTNTTYPGYMLHEAVNWNPEDHKWYFFPRRVSSLPYDDKLDEERGSNIFIVADEDFTEISVHTAGEFLPTHGFSSVVFLPGRENVVVALKSEEYGSNINTYMLVFDVNGKVLMPETQVAEAKYEGLEII